MQSKRRFIKHRIGKSALNLVAAIGLLVAGSARVCAQSAPVSGSHQTSTGLPSAPMPSYTEPLLLRSSETDYGRPRGYWRNPLGPYEPVTVPQTRTGNSTRLENLVQNGTIHLSLNDAVLLALENNYDVAIQRLNLDIADTDHLRTDAGLAPQGTSTSLVSNTLGGGGTAIPAGGGPGGSSLAGTGVGGIAVSTSGAGPTPENLDPSLTGTIELQREKQPQTNILFSGGLPSLTTNTDEYNFTYNEGFISGTSLQVSFQNSRETTNSPFQAYSPLLQSTFNAQVTQHLLQGFGRGINGRFMVQAKNNRRIADSVFRQQLLYTINQVEQIYWGLVSAYDDVQAKQRALDQSTQLVADDEKQLKEGTLAPLDLINAKSGVAADQQELISSQSNLEYQQLLMKQAIARDLDDPILADAPVIPTDRVDLGAMPEETAPVKSLVNQAEADSPAVEQAVLTLKNDSLTLKAAKNALLPTVDVFGFYGAEALGGRQSSSCLNFSTGQACPPGQYPTVGYGSVLSNLANSTGPDKGAGVNITIQIRNRPAQALQSRSELEYRQAQMRLQQLHVQIQMQVINAQYALKNDRAAVSAAEANRDYARQSLEAGMKKQRMGVSAAAAVLQQERSLATAEASLISATNRYAIDRASLEQILGSTLRQYGISIVSAATGDIEAPPTGAGTEAGKEGRAATSSVPRFQLEQQLSTARQQNP